jgi:hypothetical protein
MVVTVFSVSFITDICFGNIHTATFCNLHKENKMKVNEGVADRAFRIIVGLALIGLAVTGTIGAWGWIGIMPVLTGALGVCPAYSIFGINTCPVKK